VKTGGTKIYSYLHCANPTALCFPLSDVIAAHIRHGDSVDRHVFVPQCSCDTKSLTLNTAAPPDQSRIKHGTSFILWLGELFWLRLVRSS
jgi:hypothetical protein